MIKDIINGHLNELMNKEEELFKKRIVICEECPLYKYTPMGPICNNYLFLDPATNDYSKEEKEGYIRGCGCRLNAKTRLIDAECPAGKW